MPLDLHPTTLRWDNSYARLPDRFFARLAPTPVAAPRLVRLNLDLARFLGLDPAALDAELLAGNRVPPGAEPLAQAYAGHQFGYFSPQLGDGRAILLGEVIATDGRRYDIQLKGSGRTPWSRGGDGRAALGPVLREFILGEAMHGLGIPTTRALAAVTTGQTVQRETALPGAVLTRVAASHLRVGTFQFFAARGDLEAIRTLADYAIARHDPALAGDYGAFLRAVIARQAKLVASWLDVGFIHGVMNTDNVAIWGETIDYGPCAFMDEYDPETVFSSIDEAGRYAYGRQPRIAAWNLARLAEALLPLLGTDQDAQVAAAEAALETFAPAFEAAYSAGLRRKLGLPEGEDGAEVTTAFLRHMAAARADWTLSFRALAAAADMDDAPLTALLGPAAADWLASWRKLSPASAELLRRANPLYIARNHLVEAALAAAGAGDYAPFEALLDVLADPFTERAGLERYTLPPHPEERVLATFCGT